MRKSVYPEKPKTLGEVIRKARMDLNMPLLAVAKKAELSEGYLSRIEADKQKPTIKIMDTLARILDIHPQTYYELWFKDQFPENSPTWKHFINSLKDSPQTKRK